MLIQGASFPQHQSQRAAVVHRCRLPAASHCPSSPERREEDPLCPEDPIGRPRLLGGSGQQRHPRWRARMRGRPALRRAPASNRRAQAAAARGARDRRRWPASRAATPPPAGPPAATAQVGPRASRRPGCDGPGRHIYLVSKCVQYWQKASIHELSINKL